MAVVEYSYEEIHKLVQLSMEEIIEGLNNLGAPTEFDPESKKIKSEITPNRPDWYCVEGLARSLNIFFKGKRYRYGIKKSKEKYKVIVEPSVHSIRPYTACAVIKGIRFTEERIKDMILLQEKLVSTLGRKVKKFGLGIYPLDKVEFPIIYTAKKPGEIEYIPLGFDKKMSANEILMQHKKGLEHGHTLAGLESYPVFVDAKDKIMALIPIVNSNELGKVEEKTENIFIEVSGIDFEAVKSALSILVCSFADMGGDIFEVSVYYEREKMTYLMPNLKEEEFRINLSKINSLLGYNFDKKTIKMYLEKMGFETKKDVVLIPPYRVDILDESDIMEDLAIAHGYNKFDTTLPNFFSVGKLNKKYDQLDQIFRGMGFLEIKTFILSNKKKIGKIDKKLEEKVIEIINPLGEEYNIVRPTMIADLLETFQTNKMKKLPQMFYEVGVVNRENKTSKKVIFGICGKNIEFSEFRGYMQTLFNELQISFDLHKHALECFDEDISGIVRVKENNIGIFGRINKKTADLFELNNRVYLVELELENIL